MNKADLFPALTDPFALIFLSNWLIALENKLITHPGKFSLAKGIAIFASAFFPKFANHKPKDPPDLIILDT